MLRESTHKKRQAILRNQAQALHHNIPALISEEEAKAPLRVNLIFNKFKMVFFDSLLQKATTENFELAAKELKIGIDMHQHPNERLHLYVLLH